MGSTESGAGDFSVGSIVWVRRRNGSWWPGKIVGPEELSSSHLTSPRSGTPVKLLGREDASVDWYNLEKSKRVKAFRCGEFDDCIEKAESSQGMPVKKREKYARREDAILHALELEKQLLKKQGKLGITSERMNSKLSGSVKKGLVISSESLGNDNVKLGNSKSLKFSKRLDMSDEIIGSPLSSDRAKEGNQPSGEDDHSEVIPRMRGLQDFGLKIAPSKRKHSSYVASNGSWKPTVDGTVQALAHGGLSMGETSHVNGKHSFEQRRRSREGLSDEFLVRRPDKRRPLVQVLQNSAKLAVPQSLQPDSATVSTSVSGVEQTGAICKAKRSKCVYLRAESGESLAYEAAPSSHLEISGSPVGTRPHSESLIEENTSGFTEDESDSSETESSESESDSSETEPDMDEEMPLLSEPEVGRFEAQEHGSMVGVEPDESTHSGDMSHLYTHDPLFASEAVSKWQLKGKRNIRNLTKRSMDATDGKGYFYGPYSEEKPEMIGQDDGCSLMSRAASKSRNSVGQNMIDWEDGTWEDRSAWNEYWDIKRDRFHPVYDGRYHYRRRPRYLIDVDLKVQASYQKEPVPIVSLMSKLNGKAIIGHPIQIEALEDGSSNTLLSTIDDFGDEAIDNDGATTLPHAWRTARRTANVRVPRPHLLSAFDGDEAADDIPFLDEGRSPFKKLNIGSSSHKASQVKRNLPHNSRLPSDRKISKKVPKKVSLSSSQKTRTLSSLAIEQNFSNKPIHHDSSSCQRDGLIKPESSGPTTVACIPVKLVFSRLLEKINRPPSKAVSKAVLLNSDVERNS